MTCKDCFHFEVCDSGRHIGEYIEDDGVYLQGVEKECLSFKNKADFVEVVYCKDCSWSTERTKDNELFQYQCRNTVACGKPRRACDFCSCGERRDT